MLVTLVCSVKHIVASKTTIKVEDTWFFNITFYFHDVCPKFCKMYYLLCKFHKHWLRNYNGNPTSLHTLLHGASKYTHNAKKYLPFFRMATSLSSKISIEDRTRLFRIILIIIEDLTQILRDLLHNEVSPTQILNEVTQKIILIYKQIK